MRTNKRITNHDPIYDLPKSFRKEIKKLYGTMYPTKKQTLDVWEEMIKEARRWWEILNNMTLKYKNLHVPLETTQYEKQAVFEAMKQTAFFMLFEVLAVAIYVALK